MSISDFGNTFQAVMPTGTLRDTTQQTILNLARQSKCASYHSAVVLQVW